MKKRLTLKEKKERAYFVLSEMEKLFPKAETELTNWETPFQFLICIILSAQTTDAQVNKVTGKLFKKYPTSEDLMNAEQEDVEKIVGKVNYFRMKSKHIIQTAGIIEKDFNSVVPDDVENLTKLAGVGNKTANVFLNDLYAKNEGIGVDTHVMRTSQRLGLTENTDPDKIDKDLQKLYKKNDWHRVNKLFVLYGRYICKARVKPENSKCVFDFCSWCGNK